MVIRHNPRSKRVTKVKEQVDFDSDGVAFPLPWGATKPEGQSHQAQSSGPRDDEEIVAAEVEGLDIHAALAGDNSYLDDADYEDEILICSM